jgi:hypothetical protein
MSIQNYNQILEKRKEVRQYFSDAAEKLKSKKIKEKMKCMRSMFNYISTFGTDSVQGTAGIVSTLQDDKVVFKVSNCIDFSIEHESKALDKLNELAEFCPHFMYKFGEIDLPVCLNFFKTSKRGKHGIFQDSELLCMTPVLFTEYLSQYTFYHAIKTYDKNIIGSMILQVLTALKISQKYANFTHYDLHMDNILVRECEADTFNLYIHDNNDELLLPTYGLVPVIIDMGSCHTSNQERLLSTIENYECGCQTTTFDKLADVHHLLLSTFDCLQKYMPIAETILFKLALSFHPLPVWTGKGWKILYHQLDKELRYCLQKNSKLLNISGSQEDRDDYNHLFKEMFPDMLLILNGAITLPLLENKILENDFEKFEKELANKFDKFFKHFHNLINLASVKSDQDCLYLLKEIVNMSYQYKTINDKNDKDKAFTKMKLRMSLIMKETDMKKIKFVDFFNSINELCPLISSFYKFLESEHNVVIQKCYEQCPDGVDYYIDFFRQHLPCEYELTQNSKIYIFDAKNKEREYKTLNNISLSQLEKLNTMNLRERSKMIRKILSR